MRIMMLLLVMLIGLRNFGHGRDLIACNSALLQSTQVLYSAGSRPIRDVSKSKHLKFSPSESPVPWTTKPSLVPLPPPASSPGHQGFSISPNSNFSPKHHHRHHRHRHHHHRRHDASSPTPATMPGCDRVTCTEPLVPTPINSPCGCVLPIRVEVLFRVASFTVFPLVGQLEVEVAASLYLQQSQVRISAIAAESQEQGTIVDIELVPLGEKFDNTTALLINDRFWRKKVSVDKNHFGDYDVIYVSYPGFPFSPPSGSATASGSQEKPIVAIINKNNRMNARTITIIVLCVVVLLASLGVVSILLKCKTSRRSTMPVDPGFTSSITKRSDTESIASTGTESSSSLSLVSAMAACIFSVKRFSLAELERATGKFSSKKILGEGGFGCVYHGILDDGAEIAVKLLTRENRSGDREFIAEVEMLSRLHHRNLVKLIGICVENHKRCLVYEVVHNGSVESHLHGADKRKRSFDWYARMKVALGAARGLAYLHEDSNPRVIHRDFKASNILLEVDFTPKVSDFGLAREATEGSNYISTRVMGTFGYVAPEYAMTGHLLVKSDVYSYGVVLLELLTGRKPVDMSQPRGQENLVTWARPLLTTREGLERLVDPALNGNYDFKDIAKFASIASMCVHPEVSERPFMGEVVQALKIIYNDTEETYGDYISQKASPSVYDSDYKGDSCASDRWWETGGTTPRLTRGFASSYITMEYNSSPHEDIDDNRLLSLLHLAGKEEQVPSKHMSRSGPLRSKSKPGLPRRGSESEPGRLSMRSCENGFWV